MDDFSTMFLGLSVGPGVAAIVGVGTAVAAVFFTGWIVEKVSGFFDGGDEDEVEEGASWVCDFCGEGQHEDAYKMDYCGDLMCGACSRDDSRFS